MANRSTSRHANRKKSGGRHRVKKQTPEVVTWLGAGAITLGMGAAMASGTGVAIADTGGDSSSSSSTNSSSSSSDTKPESTSSAGAAASRPSVRSAADAQAKKPSLITRRNDVEDIDAELSADNAIRDADRPDEKSEPAVVLAKKEVLAVSAAQVALVEPTAVQNPSSNLPDGGEPVVASLLALPVAATRNGLDTEPISGVSSAEPSEVDSLSEQANVACASGEEEDGAVAGDGSPSLRTASLAAANATNTPKVSVVENYQLGHPASATAVSADGRYVYIGDNDGKVSIVDTRTNRVTTLSVANKYGDIAAAGNYVVVTSSQGTGVGTLTVIDSRNNRVLNRFTVNHAGNTPVAVALNSSGNRTYIVSHNGWVTQVDTRSGAVLGTNQVGGYLGDGSHVAVSNNKLLVARDDSSNGYTLSIVNLDTGNLNELVFNASARSVAVSPDGSRAYLAIAHDRQLQDSALIVIDLKTDTVIDTIHAPTAYGSSISDLKLSADGRRAYFLDNDYYSDVSGGMLIVLDLATGQKLDEVRFDGWRSELSITKDGKYIYLATSDQRLSAASLYAISTTVGSNYTGPEGSLEVFKTALNFLGFLDDITDGLNRTPSVWNLGALFRLNSLGQGLDSIRIGIESGNVTRILDGVVEVAVALLPKPAAFLIDMAKTVIGVLLPMGEEDQEEFMNFRAQCMFRKNTDQLSPAEASRFVERYSIPAALVNVPLDHAKYNVGGWFGRPQC